MVENGVFSLNASYFFLVSMPSGPKESDKDHVTWERAWEIERQRGQILLDLFFQ